MEFIDNKLRRYTTFSKRKTGIMKKAYELSTLTGLYKTWIWIPQILPGGSWSFGYGSTCKDNKSLSVKARNLSITRLIIGFRN